MISLRIKNTDSWAEVEGPGITIGIHPLQKGESLPTPGNNMSVGFHVKDIEEAQAILKDRGIKFPEGTKNDGPVILSFFSDPDSNPLYLCQYQS